MARGGARSGAGRKKGEKAWSDKFKKSFMKALDAEAKKRGTTIFAAFAEKFFEIDVKMCGPTYASLFKTLCEVMATKETHSTIEQHNFGPQIGLPPIKEKPKDIVFPN